MLEELLNQVVVVSMRSTYVCLGTLKRLDERYVELRHADLHDLRDSETNQENYVAAARATGIKRNRKRVVLARDDIVAVSRLDDVVYD